MKTFKRVSSLLMAMVMIMTIFTTGLTSLAAVTVSPAQRANATIVVPETIYLKPGKATFQYYLAGATTGNTPSPNATEAGQVSITTSATASSISIGYDTGVKSMTLDKTSATSTASLTAKITAGEMASAANGVITWTFTYTINDVVYTSNAYTYVYYPYLSFTGTQGGYQYKTTIGNEPNLAATAFIMGIHATDGGPRRTAFCTTSGTYTTSPLMDTWGDSNIPVATDKANFDDADTHYPLDPHGGIADAGNRSRDSSGHQHWGSENGYGILYVDSSRYVNANFNQIPNLQAGWMIHYTCNSSEKHKVSSFAGTASNASITIPDSTDIEYERREPQGRKGFKLVGTIPTQETHYKMEADFAFRRSNSSTADLYLDFGFKVIPVAKGDLRNAINAASYNNYQAIEYTSASFTAYQNAMKAAATALGKPDATQAEVDSAKEALDTAVAGLTVATAKATVVHKLPAVDGFEYTYLGAKHTAAGGYITITETQDFNLGSDVTTSSNTNFNGFTVSGTSSKSHKRASASFTDTYTYTAATSTINFNYGAGNDGYVIDGNTKSMTVTYGQPYGTFPTPRMDGWRFQKWVDGSGNTVTATGVCTMISGKLDLTASWTCNFAGGHGTQESPFEINSVALLDKIDDATAYCVFNGTDTTGTAGKYYKQTADIAYTLSKTAVLNFKGDYNGQNKAMTVGKSVIVADSAYGAVFGNVEGAKIYDINATINATFRTTGTGTAYVGFIGYAKNATMDDIQITTDGTFVGTTSGVLVSKAENSTIRNSAVTLTGGTLGGDAFLGTNTGSTLSNTWTFVSAQPTGYSTAKSNNVMMVRENGSATLVYEGGKYSFTAHPDTGWTAEYRNADDSSVSANSVYAPAATLTGKTVYLSFYKAVTITSGAHGHINGGGTFNLRQGQTVTGVTATPDTGYRFANWSYTGTDGRMAGSSPYTFTMATEGGTVTANFAVNTYTVKYNANASGAQISVPADKVYDCTQKVIVGAAPTRAGFTFKEWNSQADGKGDIYNPNAEYDALSSVNGAVVTLYAQWTANKYTVTFVDNGADTAVNNLTDILYNSNIEFPLTTKTGYKNLTWHQDAMFTDGAGYLPGTSKQIQGDSTFYAKWEPISYTIAFSATGATGIPASVTRSYDDATYQLGANDKPVKAGFVFNGWDTAPSGNGNRYYPLDSIPAKLSTVDGSTVTLYAQWTAAVYTITWDLTGGNIGGKTENPENQATFGGKYTIPAGTPTKSGYKFRGWYTAETAGAQVTAATTVSVTANTSFYAQWDNAQYTIIYNANGGKGEMADQKVTHGQGFTLAANTFTRPGYKFTGWNTVANGSGIAYNDAVSVTADPIHEDGSSIILYAQWEGSKFSITFNYNAGAGTIYKANGTAATALMPKTVTMGGASATLQTTTNYKAEGDDTYSFYGWAYSVADANALKKAYEGGGSFLLTEEILSKCEVDWSKSTPTITLYAVWARNTKITWKLTGGKLNGSTEDIVSTVPYGSKLALPEGEPTRNRFAFAGWFTAAVVGTGVQVTNNTVLETTADTTYYAQWVQTGNLDSTYKTEYYLQNGDGTYPATASYTSESTGEIATEVTAVKATYTGYTLDETNANTVAKGLVLDNLEGQTLVLKLYYTINKYKVTFNANGGTGTMDQQTFIYNTEGTLNTNKFSRTGYSFLGWARTATAEGAAYTNGGHFTIGAADVTLYAVWDQLTYTISFNSDGGSAVTAISAHYGDAIQAPANPTKKGYTFGGWMVSGTTGLYTIPTTMPANNVSLTAKWTAIDYTLAYNANGGTGTMAPKTFHIGDKVTVAANGFTRTGYTFQGWATTATGTADSEYAPGASFTADAANVTLYAVWNRVTYTMSFNSDGGSAVASISKFYDEVITAPANPTKRGNTFGGWLRDGKAYTVPAKMPAENVSLTAKWVPIDYTLSYDGNGGTGSMASKTFHYGDNVLVDTNTFTKTGYTFMGWSTTKGGSVAYGNGVTFIASDANVTFYAVWVANAYVVELRPNKGIGDVISINCDYGETYELPETEFTKVGYTFKGWAASADGEVLYKNAAQIKNLTAISGGKVVLYAVWENVIYTVSFNNNGATGGTTPEALEVIYEEEITLPQTNLVISNATTERTFIGWRTADETTYAPGATFTAPAEDVVLYAVFSANYKEFNAITTTVKGFRDSGKLPASASKDPAYAKDGSVAEILGSTDGMYSWNSFDTELLESVYQETIKSENRNLPQTQQSKVDMLVRNLFAALNAVELLPVDYSVRYTCFGGGIYEMYTGLIYPECEEGETHSFDSIKKLIDDILNADAEKCIYTEESVEALRETIYGNGGSTQGIVNETLSANIKLPAQSMLETYVESMSSAYHNTLALKSADFTAFEALLTDYLPTKTGVSYDNLLTYYTPDSVDMLYGYYANVDRDIPIVAQFVVDEDYCVTLKDMIDYLVPNMADYTDVFATILKIPYGTKGFAYPTDSIVTTDYETWITWAYMNAGNISECMDDTYLRARYTETSVVALYNVLNAIDWEMDVFSQDSVNGAGNGRSYVTLLNNAINALERRTYTVTFMMNDGTETVFTTSKGNYYGDLLGRPISNPTREGFVFKGWGLDAEGQEMATLPGTVQGEMTIYAIWESIFDQVVELTVAAGSSATIDREKGYIYGLKEAVTKDEMDNVFLQVVGNGHLEYEYLGNIGTGTVVKLINDYTGEVVETFQIVIFGDTNGDGMINSADLTDLKGMLTNARDSSMNNVYAFAADIYSDQDINSTDLTRMKMILANTSKLDQVTREMV